MSVPPDLGLPLPARPPAVAGLFYPATAGELGALVDELVAEAGRRHPAPRGPGRAGDRRHPRPARGAGLLGDGGCRGVARRCRAVEPRRRADDRAPRHQPRRDMARRRGGMGRRPVVDAARRGGDRPAAHARHRGPRPAVRRRRAVPHWRALPRGPASVRGAPRPGGADRGPVGGHRHGPARGRGRRAAGDAAGGAACSGRVDPAGDQHRHGPLPGGRRRRARDRDAPSPHPGARARGPRRRGGRARRDRAGPLLRDVRHRAGRPGPRGAAGDGRAPGDRLAGATSADAGGDPRRTVGYLAVGFEAG